MEGVCNRTMLRDGRQRCENVSFFSLFSLVWIHRPRGEREREREQPPTTRTCYISYVDRAIDNNCIKKERHTTFCSFSPYPCKCTDKGQGTFTHLVSNLLVKIMKCISSDVCVCVLFSPFAKKEHPTTLLYCVWLPMLSLTHTYTHTHATACDLVYMMMPFTFSVSILL